MAHSKAHRRRSKLLREGKLNPGIMRRGWGNVNPLAKTTPTLQETKNKQQHKHKHQWTYSEHQDGSFLFYIKYGFVCNLHPSTSVY